MATWPKQRSAARASGDEEYGSPPPDAEAGADDSRSSPPAATARPRRAGTALGGSGDSTPDDVGEGAGLELEVSAWRASLPQPSELAGYEAALPGASERILAMVEKSHAAQTKAAALAVESEVRSVKRSQYIALLLIVVGIGASIVFFALDNVVAGIIYVTIPIVVLLRFPESYRAEGGSAIHDNNAR
ncbi:MAG: putative rane protein [Nocardioidaceae bacterium]|nr:putative rane protein [Nocardioidaceae bacterium]